MSLSNDCSDTSGSDLGLKMPGENLFLRLLAEKNLKYANL